jgi:hypothetical protein
MARVMRLNEYKTDPLSVIQECGGCSPRFSPSLAIAERSDLVDPAATFGNLTAAGASHFKLFGFAAIDAKFVSFEQLEKGELKFFAQSGPTTQGGTPAFAWATAQPVVQEQRAWAAFDGPFDFPWVESNGDAPTVVPIVYPRFAADGQTPESRFWSDHATAAVALAGVVLFCVVVVWLWFGRSTVHAQDDAAAMETKNAASAEDLTTYAQLGAHADGKSTGALAIQ